MKKCEMCGKHPVSGSSISHAHNVNKRVFFPNLRTIKTTINGVQRRTKICMRCLKTIGK